MSQLLKPVGGACAAVLLSLASLQAQNTVSGTSTSSGIGAGNRNLIYNSLYAWIGGGFTNVIVNGANFSTIGGGYSNAVTTGATFATIGGGSQNLAGASFATVGGGEQNQVMSLKSTIGGGFANTNTTNANFSTIGGGGLNLASQDLTTVAGGYLNIASGYASAIGGGYGNRAQAGQATVAGGLYNTAGAEFATVSGGATNTASGTSATVSGGYSNTASGSYSHASGYGALASNSLAFVWSGSTAGAISTNANSFTVRAPGGARFLSAASGVSNGVVLTANGAAWASLSDSNAKTDIEPVNARDVLRKVAALPVTSWHYKHDLSRRYIGPMAQDFHAAFGLGADDKTITTLDTDGVTLAAIKGLVVRCVLKMPNSRRAMPSSRPS